MFVNVDGRKVAMQQDIRKMKLVSGDVVFGLTRR
jgi:hypothetical protein